MTPFHAYYQARMLDGLPEQEKLLPVFAASNITAYPFQIAAARFALRSPWQKGVILCDEAGLGKSHEALLIMVQRYLEGATHILLCIPNIDLLTQWLDLLERCYTIPYTVLSDRKDFAEENAFDHSGIVITTYDLAAIHKAEATAIEWDLVAFEEANALSGVYREDSKLPRALHRIAGNAFKLLLTGTPIEKNIMDLYGMIWFIDDSVLLDEHTFLARYLRRPENYPELADRVSKYCFRTLRAQAKQYAKLPERVLLTHEYIPTPEEQALYRLLYDYINRPGKLAFPEMDSYDLALRLLGLQSSSTAAIRQTMRGVLARLEAMPDAETEITEVRKILAACDKVKEDAKVGELRRVLHQGFSLLKKRGVTKKAVIFTESVETQKMLFSVVSQTYKAVLYNGSTGYAAIEAFQADAEVLIATDHGAKGFHLANAAFVIHYDLLYNTLKMEQRIDRCHRLGQESDVLSVAFINKENFADVRKLELVGKRTLVSNGVFGVSDEVIGGFTDDLSKAFDAAEQRLRPAAQVEADYQSTLAEREAENKQLVASAEDMLFTTFTKELAEKVRLSPSYIDAQIEEWNAALWELAKYFFTRWNEEHDECFYEIDEAAQTITATGYDTLPVLFYYWDGSRNKPYRSQKQYGVAKDFKPRHGRITLTSIIGRGILHELACADSATITVHGKVEPCKIVLYRVIIYAEKRRISEQSVLVGRTDAGIGLTDEQCRALLALPVESYTEEGRAAPQWLKSNSKFTIQNSQLCDDLNEMANDYALLIMNYELENLSPALAEEAERLQRQTKQKKAGLAKDIAALETRIKALESERDGITGDRLKRLSLEKEINRARKEFLSRQENQFFDALRLDLELEEQLKALAAREKLTAKVTREFVVRMEESCEKDH